MKILLRSFCNDQYVWKTAKYNKGHFIVDGVNILYKNIVSIISDNRKKYVRCSSCGQIFKRGDAAFHTHTENAAKPETCFDCPNLIVDETRIHKRKLVKNEHGDYVEKLERNVELKCSAYNGWSYAYIDSATCISRCPKRKCGDAIAEEVTDFFTEHPGVFDDIITIDQISSKGFELSMAGMNNEVDFELDYTDDFNIGVVINRLGIVDRFYVWFDGESHDVYYSKKYDELYCISNGQYEQYWPYFMEEELRTEIKSRIANLYI